MLHCMAASILLLVKLISRPELIESGQGQTILISALIEWKETDYRINFIYNLQKKGKDVRKCHVGLKK
jgi:hypothetical protein